MPQKHPGSADFFGNAFKRRCILTNRALRFTFQFNANVQRLGSGKVMGVKTKADPSTRRVSFRTSKISGGGFRRESSGELIISQNGTETTWTTLAIACAWGHRQGKHFATRKDLSPGTPSPRPGRRTPETALRLSLPEQATILPAGSLMALRMPPRGSARLRFGAPFYRGRARADRKSRRAPGEFAVTPSPYLNPYSSVASGSNAKSSLSHPRAERRTPSATTRAFSTPTPRRVSAAISERAAKH